MALFPVVFPWKKSQMCQMCMGNGPNLVFLLAKWTNMAVFASKIANFGLFPTHSFNRECRCDGMSDHAGRDEGFN